MGRLLRRSRSIDGTRLAPNGVTAEGPIRMRGTAPPLGGAVLMSLPVGPCEQSPRVLLVAVDQRSAYGRCGPTDGAGGGHRRAAGERHLRQDPGRLAEVDRAIDHGH